ncbi:hypothetical protein CUMW_220110 [Citrus unshiu]|uniref:Amine oxidase domain-containing protein n=1 Tax=Citrus unshiu TaxID=55188 RepID=A0A2H5QDL7_CITUN|nr:hypothetical protein CUMW_220110 [Citrus unshiu]
MISRLTVEDSWVGMYESRSFIGGKVGSFIDKHGNHTEMGLHVFFGCYNNPFRLMKKVGADKNLLMKDHSHTFVNKGGEIGVQTYDKARNALALALSPVVKALGDPEGALKDIRDLDSVRMTSYFLVVHGRVFRECGILLLMPLGLLTDNISARCMLTIFALFATKTKASLLRMFKGSPDVYLRGPIRKYITDKGGRFHLRWGCREILYDKSANGETYVKGLAMSKATDKKVVQADA